MVIYESVFVKNLRESFKVKPEKSFEAALNRMIYLEEKIRKQNHAFYLLTNTQKFKYSKLFEADEELIEFHKMTRNENFYKSKAWLNLRHEFLLRNKKKKCNLCGLEDQSAQYHVDHIRPRSVYPELCLEIKNLQLLCKECNLGKSNKVSGLEKIAKIHPQVKLRKKEASI